MNRERLAERLLTIAEELVSADTFKCPDCGSKVLEQTGFCVKCKKKVKKGSDRTAAATPFMDAIAKVWKENRGLRNHPEVKNAVRKYDIINAAMALDDALAAAARDEV